MFLTIYAIQTWRVCVFKAAALQLKCLRARILHAGLTEYCHALHLCTCIETFLV